MQTVLQAIEEGIVSLTQSPPELYTDCPDLKARHGWTKQYTSFRAPSQKEALGLGVKAFLENPHLTSFGYSELEKLIAADMMCLQRQPGIMHRYRRYVVINAQMDGLRYCGESDGVSYTYLRDSHVDLWLYSWSGPQLRTSTFRMIFILSKHLPKKLAKLWQTSCNNIVFNKHNIRVK
jgi:hypothetical protein